MVAERANRLRKRLRIGRLEERVASVGRQPAEQVRTQHGRDHRAVSPTRLAGDAAMTRLGQRAIAGVDPGDDLVAKVRVVFARAGRVDVLAATDRGPGVDVDEDAGRRAAGGELGVRQLGKVLPHGWPIPPHVDLAGQAHDHVDARIAALRIRVIPGRQVDPERPAIGIAERVALEHLALEEMLVVASLRFERPGGKIGHHRTIDPSPARGGG